MPKITIIKKLIPHYKNVIKEIKKTDTPYLEVLQDTGTGMGICWCATSIFDTSIYFEKWVQAESKHDDSWAMKPNFAESRQEAISLLQYRVDVMEKILEQSKKKSDARRKAKAKGAK